MSWKLVARAPKRVVQAALAAHEALEDWDPEIVLTGNEIAEEHPDQWMLEAYLPRRPRQADRAAVAALFGPAGPGLAAEKLPDSDWVAETQRLTAPIRAGRFHVRTPDFPAEPGAIDLVIPAAQAFGTGQHATTAGCLAMLDAMKRRGVVTRNLADIGTGTGLLAFAALRLWPGARAIASDVDPVCERVVVENGLLNQVPLGTAPGELAMVVAEGFDHPLLAGLLTTQEPAVRAACRTAGFRLAARIVEGDWSILWLRRRAQPWSGSG